ncbi:SRPBCC domain-containing protein [Jannaschia sp. M317]|uniref:SRPBCC family protein n=1 Tax=Jannaschia sp. M317 TaxID=2867011 RepID=UPI0021A7896D|nr:SRPBCC domain-containing protein [Jannaschia sp. M317]UWQ17680.1 SRPBCC domain-containing protein [Jannaschia sp. M317]
MTDEQTWVRIIRNFAAPRAAIWKMWTDPAAFAQWYGPRGMSVPVAEMDLRVGGLRRICMTMDAPDRDMTMWFTGVFKEIRAPERLVYTESMCTEDGTLISPASMGMPEGTPDVTEVIVELSETADGTRMTMVHVGVPEGSAGAGGWAQAFDKLDTVLAS